VKIRLVRVSRLPEIGDRAPLLLAALWSALVAIAIAGDVTGLCHFKRITGVPCPCCGGSRGVLRLIAGDLPGALAMNPLLVLTGTVLVAVAAIRLVGGRRAVWSLSVRGRRVAWAIAAAALLLNWVYVATIVG
jgi:hypothetical protein